MTKASMVYSHSRLETFEQCRLKFKFQYIDKVDVPERNSIEAFLGSRVHETLEALYKSLLNGKRWAKDECVRFFADVWEKEKTDSLFIVNKQYSIEDYFESGRAALEKYWEHYYPFEQEKTIALEQRVFLHLDDGKQYKMQGIIDRISKTPEGIWQIRDYKTKRSLPTLQEASQDRQLALYQIALQSMWENTDKVELIWHFLLFDEEIKSSREKSDLERLKIDTIHAIQDVEKAIEKDDFPYTESRLCDWCDYYDICPAKKHLAAVSKLPPREFKADEGVVLADEYTRLEAERAKIKLQLDEIESEIEKLKDEIVAYCKQFTIAKLYGSTRYLNVSSKETYHVPSSDLKGERELRQELEMLLKNHKVWDSVSILNGQRLVKMFENEELPAFLIDKLRNYLTATTRRRISTGHLREYDENFEQ